MIDFAPFTHLTFDCYGTLIDWETGILAGLHTLLQAHQVTATDEQLLQLYTQYEAEEEAGVYQPYRQVLAGVLRKLAARLGFVPTPAELAAFAASAGRWPPFADTVAALQQLQRCYQLVIISNIDDDLFAQTNQLLQVQFAAIITAQQVGSYKPAMQNFHTALQRIGAPINQVLYVAQSLYHDHAPAKALGFTTVWVNRPSRLPGAGLSLPVDVTPDLEVADMRSLVEQMGI